MGSHTMRVFSLTMMATTALMATLCASLPEGGLGYLGDLEAAEGDLADLQDQEYLDSLDDIRPTHDKRFMGGIYQLPTFAAADKRFSPDSVKMALIRAFVKQVRHHIIMERYHNKQMRSIRGRRMAVVARPQQRKRELMKAEVLRSVNDVDGLEDAGNHLPISSVKAAAQLGKVGASWSLIRSPFGVFRLRPQDPTWMDMMEHVGK